MEQGIDSKREASEYENAAHGNSVCAGTEWPCLL